MFRLYPDPMKTLPTWIFIIGALATAVLGNTLGTLWAKGESKISLWLLAVIVVSPLVFITFGLVTSRIGLAVSSAVIDTLLTVSTIAVGLLIFREWDKLSALQYVGMALALTGVFLMLYFSRENTSMA